MGRHVDEFLQAMVADRAATRATVRNYRSDLQGFLAFAAERGLGPETVDRECVRHWIGERAVMVSPGTRRRQLSALRSFFGWLQAHGLRCGNPMAGIVMPRKAHKLPRVLSVREAALLIESASGAGFAEVRARAVLEVLYGAGLRVAELAALNESDVTPATGEIMVRRGKGDRDRVVFVGAHAQAALDRWCRARHAFLRRLSVYQPALFVNARDGGRLDVRSLQTIVRQAGERIGLKGLHPHVLRHTFATHLIDGGADVLMVSKLLGHASVLSTQVYTKLATSRLARTIRESHPRG